jgi:hypothetical protein
MGRDFGCVFDKNFHAWEKITVHITQSKSTYSYENLANISSSQTQFLGQNRSTQGLSHQTAIERKGRNR